MDRHVKWLRRRILASVATQTAETFAVVAVLAFALMQWLTSEGPLTALFGSVVIAQLVAVARIGHAMRSNPLNYVFMRKYVERPFAYRVSRFQGEDEAHATAEQLPGFAPVATIRDADADPEPVFDIYHDPSRLVAASVSRASGSVALVSSLDNGRLLITDARLVPPHERIVMSLAKDDQVATVIATHRRALSSRSDVVQLASSAHQVILDSLALEYDAYVSLGPALSPFLDLEAGRRSPFRLIARVKPAELLTLPARLGPDMPLPKSRSTVPAPNPAEAKATQAQAAQAQAAEAQAAQQPVSSVIPQVVAPAIVAPDMVAADIAQPDMVAPDMVAPDMVAATIAAFNIAPPATATPGPVAPDPVAADLPMAPPGMITSAAAEPGSPDIVVAPVGAAPSMGSESASSIVGGSIPLEPVSVSTPDAPVDTASPEPVMAIRLDVAPRTHVPQVEAAADQVVLEAVPPFTSERPKIAPSHFVTVEPDADDVLTTGEPVTAEVPVVELTTAPAPEPFVPSATEPLDLQAALAALPTNPIIDANPPFVPQAPTPATAPPDPQPSVDPNPAMQGIAPATLAPATLAPAATLAEAVVAAPDNPAALTEGLVAITSPALTEATVVAASPNSVPAFTAPASAAPVFTAPASAAPVFTAPASAAPVFSAPASAAPTFTAPASAAPTFSAPSSAVPSVVAPVPVAAGINVSPPQTSPAVPISNPTNESTSFVTMPSSLMASPAPSAPTEARPPQDLAAALGYSGETRPRLSAVLRSNASAEAKRSRRKHR